MLRCAGSGFPVRAFPSVPLGTPTPALCAASWRLRTGRCPFSPTLGLTLNGLGRRVRTEWPQSEEQQERLVPETVGVTRSHPRRFIDRARSIAQQQSTEGHSPSFDRLG